MTSYHALYYSRSEKFLVLRDFTDNYNAYNSPSRIYYQSTNIKNDGKYTKKHVANFLYLPIIKHFCNLKTIKK